MSETSDRGDGFSEELAALYDQEAAVQRQLAAEDAAREATMGRVVQALRGSSIPVPPGIDLGSLGVTTFSELQGPDGETPEPVRGFLGSLHAVCHVLDMAQYDPDESHVHDSLRSIASTGNSDEVQLRWIRLLEGVAGLTILDPSDDQANVGLLEGYRREEGAAQERWMQERYISGVARQRLSEVIGMHDDLGDIATHVLLVGVLRARDPQADMGLATYLESRPYLDERTLVHCIELVAWLYRELGLEGR